MDQFETKIAVCGCHGKSTTTALLAYVGEQLGLPISYYVGAPSFMSLPPGRWKRGDYFVVEADEYRKSSESNNPKFLDLTPTIEIITSIEMDHPDFFSSEEKVYDAFYKFAIRTPRTGFIVLCSDYPKAKKIPLLTSFAPSS